MVVSLAVLLWPPILLGVDLHLGRTGGGKAGAIWALPPVRLVTPLRDEPAAV